jgi:AcrR family transcriptional regulator
VTLAVAVGTHQRVVDAAVALTAELGWASVTMSDVAARAGVSRQTVYNEVGTRQGLAEAMVLDELGRFLATVDDAFARHPEDLEAAVRAAVRAVLDRAATNELLRAVVSPTGGGELLPPLTTDSGAVLEAATRVVDAQLDGRAVGVDRRTRTAAVDMLVRTVLSHVMQPSAPPARTAARVSNASARPSQKRSRELLAEIEAKKAKK